MVLKKRNIIQLITSTFGQYDLRAYDFILHPVFVEPAGFCDYLNRRVTLADIFKSNVLVKRLDPRWHFRNLTPDLLSLVCGDKDVAIVFVPQALQPTAQKVDTLCVQYKNNALWVVSCEGDGKDINNVVSDLTNTMCKEALNETRKLDYQLTQTILSADGFKIVALGDVVVGDSRYCFAVVDNEHYDGNIFTRLGVSYLDVQHKGRVYYTNACDSSIVRKYIEKRMRSLVTREVFYGETGTWLRVNDDACFYLSNWRVYRTQQDGGFYKIPSLRLKLDQRVKWVKACLPADLLDACRLNRPNNLVYTPPENVYRELMEFLKLNSREYQASKNFLYAAPTSGKSTLKEQLADCGIDVLDTDDLFGSLIKDFRWDENVGARRICNELIVTDFALHSVPASTLILTNLVDDGILKRTFVRYSRTKEDLISKLSERGQDPEDFDWINEFVPIKDSIILGASEFLSQHADDIVTLFQKTL